MGKLNSSEHRSNKHRKISQLGKRACVISTFLVPLIVGGCTTHTLQPMRLGADNSVKDRMLFEVNKVSSSASWALNSVAYSVVDSVNHHIKSDNVQHTSNSSTHVINVFPKPDKSAWLLSEDIKKLYIDENDRWVTAHTTQEIPEGRKGALVWADGGYVSSQDLMIASTR